MIFNSLIYYLAFLLPSAYLFRRIRLSLRPWIIAAFGSLFFVYFSVTSVGGIRGAACISIILWQSFCCVYLCRHGSRLCFLVIAQAIVFLAVFKYLNFFTTLAFGTSRADPFYWHQAFLPLGISFFTFEFIHYAVDAYQGKITNPRLPDFLAFVLFFPTMVAGPIKRYQDFAPKITQNDSDWAVDWHRGISRILTGLVKKFAIADVLTAVTVHLNAVDIAHASGRAALLIWIFAYGFKIYFDFSSYSDIAIGSARLFGIRVPENFDSPYLQRNIAEFWQHWHISLYRWLIDYIYIPLGGSRVQPILVYRNLVIVMLASGLWHGAGLNFLAWGAWHAILLCMHRLWSRATSAFNPALSSPLASVISWLITYVTVNLGWAFFVMDFKTAMLFFHRLLLN